MEGGAMRGMFTAGVIDVLMENGIEFDGAIGVSAGACFGCNYKSGQIGRTIRYNLKYCRDKRFCSFWSLFFTGNIFGADFCYKELPNKLDIFDNEAYINHPMEFYVVCTDAETGKSVYKKCETLDESEMEWMRGSASLPLVSEIVEIDGYKLSDGGTADSVPIKYFESIGYDRNVVILTQPKGYVKSRNPLIPVMKIVLRKYPKLIEAAKRRHVVYNETTKYIFDKEEKGELFVFCPKEKLPVSHMERDPERLKNAYNLGREAAIERLDEIKEYLNK